jgi:hypothetical protein
MLEYCVKYNMKLTRLVKKIRSLPKVANFILKLKTTWVKNKIPYIGCWTKKNSISSIMGLFYSKNPDIYYINFSLVMEF